MLSVNLQTGFRFGHPAWQIATTKIIAFPWAVYRLSPVCGGLLAIRVEVLVVGPVVQYVPHGDEQLACHGHEDFHLVLLAYLRHAVGESAEEAFLGSACPPCALYDGLAEEHVAVGDSARLVLPAGHVIAWFQPAPGCKVRRSQEFGLHAINSTPQRYNKSVT